MTAAARRQLYRVLSWFVYLVFTDGTRLAGYLFTRWEIDGIDHIPPNGPVILVCNHLHILDPPLVAASVHRRVYTMAKRELFDAPLVGWTLWPYGAFPVRRFAADIGALRAARALLRRGEVVMMFPEGTRSRDARLHAALPGAAMVALLADAPIVPVAITGTDRVRLPRDLFAWVAHRRPRIRVAFGESFRLSSEGIDARHPEEAIDSIMRRVAALLPESYRGAYGRGSEGQVVFARQERDRT